MQMQMCFFFLKFYNFTVTYFLCILYPFGIVLVLVSLYQCWCRRISVGVMFGMSVGVVFGISV